MDRLVIGVVAKAQGIKGEIKVLPLTDNEQRFSSLKKFFIGAKEYEIESVKLLPNGVFVQLVGIYDRNTAEELRGKHIELDRSIAVKLPSDRNFIVDLIGCEILLGDKVLGKVAEILQNGSADVYVIKGAKEFMFPAVRDVFLDIDVKKKRIVLDKKRFEEVAVYED